MSCNYPLHPGQTEVSPYYVQVPMEEYEALKSENRQLHQLLNGVKSQNSDTEIDTLANECRILREMNMKAQEEIATLKENQRWRKCSDGLPTPDEGYVLVLWEDGIPDIGYIGAEVDVVETVRDRGERHSVEFWRPLSKAPEGV